MLGPSMLFLHKPGVLFLGVLLKLYCEGWQLLSLWLFRSKIGGSFKASYKAPLVGFGVPFGLEQGRFTAHPCKSYMVVSEIGTVLLAGACIIIALLFGVYATASDVRKL